MPSPVLPAELAGLPVPGIPGTRLADVAGRLVDGSLPGFLDQLANGCGPVCTRSASPATWTGSTRSAGN
jgi:hypothetical protein